MTDLGVHIRAALSAAIDDGLTPGAVCAVSIGGVAIEPVAAGFLESIGGAGRPLLMLERTAVTPDTRYDTASVTKLFSAVTILRLVEEGSLDLDIPIAEWLDDYRGGLKRAVTLRHLLTHTSGLPDAWLGWHDYVEAEGTAAARWHDRGRPETLRAILALPLVSTPGRAYVYSCLGYITAMACAETATGRDWAGLVSNLVITPLGLEQTGYLPAAAERVAPTEFEPAIGRGLVRGVVHDETAYALGGVSANAGLFATAGDLRRFGEAMLAGFPGILGEESARDFWQDQLPAVLSGGPPPDWGQGLGPRIGQLSWMGLPAARGHAGFTGTSLLVDRDRELVVALMTNRVHPSREAADGNTIRAMVHHAILAQSA